MLTVLGLKSSAEDDKPWWRKDSYIRANEVLNCLLEEYMISRLLKKFSAKGKNKSSKEGLAIELEPSGGIKSKLFVTDALVSVL